MMRARDQGWRSRWADIGGPVRYLDFGGPRRAPALVCVHGLGGSAVNWLALAPLLTGRYRVLAPDLAGHGLTRSAGRGTDVQSNARLLTAFLAEVAGGPAVLAGNSMGGMISLLAASDAPESVSSLILVDPALPFRPALPDPAVAAMFALTGVPVLGRATMSRVAALPPEQIVAGALALCCADPARVSPAVVACHVTVARQRQDIPDAADGMASATRSVVATAGLGRGALAYRQAIRAVTQPVLLLHGEADRLVPVSAARAAARTHPDWTLVTLPGAGHVPQLEVPQECAAAILGWHAGPDDEPRRQFRRRERIGTDR